MALTYRRPSNTGSHWGRDTNFLSRTALRVSSPASNQQFLYDSGSYSRMSRPASPSVNGPLSDQPLLYQTTSKPLSDQPLLYQSTSKPTTASNPTLPAVKDTQKETSSDPREEPENEFNTRTNSWEKGKEPAVVRTRPIFHPNLEAAKRYHQERAKTLSPKNQPICCEEIISRYCEHFKFQLPVLEVDRYKKSGKKRVFLRIKRRLLGIGEGQTTFEAILAAYDDTVIYLFKGDPLLKTQLLQDHETIEWKIKKVEKPRS